MSDIEYRVKTIVSEQLEIGLDKIHNEASFMQGLGADSLD